jgi:DNA-binding HxlR family transcriptional regulator
VKRSYGQYCALAKTLDVIGGRWTMLIMRELMIGPRRFRDLMDGLPGIGTNLLSERLRELQEAEVIHKRTLPPPAGSTVYELTGEGQALVPALLIFSRWGLARMEAPGKDEEFRTHWFMTAAMAAFRPEAAQGVTLTSELRANATDVAHFRIADGRLEVIQGPASDPDLSLEGNPRALIDLFRGAVPPEEAVLDGIRLDGDLETLKQVLAIFGAPQAAESLAAAD